MHGIDLNSPIHYELASFRFFKNKEHHIERICGENVLLMVHQGVLRFSENGEQVLIESIPSPEITLDWNVKIGELKTKN